MKTPIIIINFKTYLESTGKRALKIARAVKEVRDDSGVEIMLKHSWAEKGNYTIRAKTRDINGAESAWETLEINIPRNRALIYNFKLLGWFLERFQNAFPLIQYLLRF